MIRNKNDQRRRGVSTIELALILPFIFLLAMSFIELGNMFTAWMTIQKAAQSGARFAATGIGDEDDTRLDLIIGETRKWMSSLGGEKVVTVMSWPTTDTSDDGIADDPGTPCGLVEVAVTYDYHPVTPIAEAIFPTVIKLSSQDRKLNEPWKPCGK